MTNTVVSLLASDLLAWLAQRPDGIQRRVLLWLDPNREFARLTPHLAPMLASHGARLLAYAPEAGVGQLTLKLETLRTLKNDTGGALVLYLPGFGAEALEPTSDGSAPGLWALYEYRYTGCIWGRGTQWEPGQVARPVRLYEWLRAHGMELPSDSGRTTRELADGGADSLLARHAELRRDTDPATWPRPLRTDDVRASLGGDPHSRLRELIAAPGHAVSGWEDPALTVGRIVDEFGLNAPNPLPHTSGGALDGHALAAAFATQLALTETWDAFGRPDDFPYRDGLPHAAERQERQLTFVRDELLPHARLGPAFRELVEQTEPAYPLAAWATNRAGAPGAFPLLARARWQAALAAFDQAAAMGLRAAREWLQQHAEMVASGAVGENTGDTHWTTLANLAKLCDGTESARQDATVGRDAAGLIRHYTEDWWRLDAIHLELLAQAMARPGLEQVRQMADLALCSYVAAASDVFSGCIEHDTSWPPASQRAVADLRAALWSVEPGQRRGVIISDALRWDLGQRVCERLERATGAGRTITMEPYFATLPSITPFGMTALLPLDQLPSAEATLSVSYAGGATIKDAAGRALSTRDGRKALLEVTLPRRGNTPTVAFLDMEDLLAGAPIPPAPIVVVFDNDIDQQGHKGGDQFPRLALDLSTNIAGAIERLHEAGVTEAHVVTDHGFLLLPPAEVDALGRPELPVRQVERREPRWAALKPDAPVDGVVRLPNPLDPTGPTLAFPRGVRTLVAAQPYEHGGVSLQECVLPHLISRVVTQATRVGVQVTVTREQLTGGTVPVILKPERAQTSLWSEERPTLVRLWVEVADGATSGYKITDPIDVEMRAESDEVRPGVYLREDTGLALHAGQALRLRAVDQETRRDLATIALTLLVDWE